MKLVALALLLVSTTAAEAACPHSRQQFICPGDPVVDQYNRAGQATAMNPFQKTVAYRLNSGSIASTDLSNMSLGVGCLEAFCVGDQVADQYNRAGIVIAVNPYQGTIAYRLNSGSLASTDIQNLSNTNFCEEYGESHRSRRRYPELPRNRYAAPDFKYYSRR